MKKKYISIIENLVYWSLLIVVFYMLGKDSIDIRLLIRSIQGGDYIFLLTSVGLILVNLFILATIFKNSFELANVDLSILRMLKNVLVSLTLGIVTPLGSTGSSAYLIKKFKKKFNIPAVNSLLGVIFELFFINVVFLLISFLGIIFLKNSDQLNNNEVYAFLLEGLLVGVIILLLTLLLIIPRFIMKTLGFVSVHFISIFKKDIWKNDEKIMSNVAKLHHLIKGAFRKKKLILFNFLFTLAYYSVYLLILYLLSVAFHIDISMINILIIFVIIMVVTIVSPSPQGIGFAEGFAQLVAKSLGINPSNSFLLIMSYRIITLWIPVLLGSFVLQYEKIIHWLNQRKLSA